MTSTFWGHFILIGYDNQGRYDSLVSMLTAPPSRTYEMILLFVDFCTNRSIIMSWSWSVTRQPLSNLSQVSYIVHIRMANGKLTSQSVLARGRAGTLPTHMPELLLITQYHLKMIINRTHFY